ncbi:alpha-2-macroglobulin family protein [Chitinophagaceae bacterium MMS25-I14]
MSQKTPYEKEYRKADSLLLTGLPQSARKIIQAVYEQARKGSDNVQVLKAQIYLLNLHDETEDNADSAAIAWAEARIAETSFPEKNIWQSITAGLYWQYYSNNRWKIMDRTTVSGDRGTDFEQWDAKHFYEKVSSLYKSSLDRRGMLQQTDIRQFDPVLRKGVHTEGLRPTLYDLLAFRAVTFFENDETELTRPANQFTMDDTAAFGDPAVFAKHHFETADTTSFQFLALQIYQRIISFHLKSNIPDALIDADIHRIKFVYAHAVMPDKKELYEQALGRIAQKYTGNATAAEAAYLLAVSKYDNGVQAYPRGRKRMPQAGEKKKGQLPQLKKELDAIVATFPQSEGGVHAQQKLMEISGRELNLQAEKVVLPSEPSKVQISYRNVNKIYLRIIADDISNLKNNDRYYDDNRRKKLISKKPLQSWIVVLPGTEDFDTHTTEIKIDALPQGQYILFAGTEEDMAADKGLLSYVPFQVSHIALIATGNNKNNTPSGYVLDRKTGEPLANAALSFFIQKYNSKTQQYDNEVGATCSSGADGAFRVALKRNYESYNGVMVKHGQDQLYVSDYLSFNENEEVANNTLRAFFFTDRSIYRPGQTIYFKAILVQADSDGRKNKVLPNQKTDVTFYDANGQKIKSVQLQSNEFGSVQGSFIAPSSGLTGQMRISNDIGDCYVSVEEYKRPKFDVTFDTLKSSYALNETIQVTGIAKAYAGNNIDGAAVKYRVVRTARFPYYWMFYRWGAPSSPEMEIVNGTVKTDADGHFNISFKAIPDLTIDEQSGPVFSYAVTADVTDINGETHSGTQYVEVGYRSLQIVTEIPEQVQQLDSFMVTTKNLAGTYVPADIRVRILPLRSPGMVYRQRVWEMPDQYLMDEASFRKDFPLDEYKNESNHLNWPEETAVFDKTIHTTKEGMINKHIPFERNGWYVVVLETKDKNGKPVEEKKYIQVCNTSLKGNTPDAAVVINEKPVAEPGEKAKIYLASGLNDMHWVQMTGGYKDATVQQVNAAGDKPIIWTKEIQEKDRGGIALNWVGIKNNRVYQETSAVSVPWSNKDLHISWETHRDKLLPGAKETWTMIVKGAKKDHVAAEMAATLYDASLDALKGHSWGISGLYPGNYNYFNWNTGLGFGSNSGQSYNFLQQTYPSYAKQYDELMQVASGYSRGGRYALREATVAYAAPAIAGAAAPAPGNKLYKKNADRAEVANTLTGEPLVIKNESDNPDAVNPSSAQKPISIRKNLQETAFFYPQLKTDDAGNIRIEFTMPEALTEWKLMAFAHTKDMQYGLLEGKVKTQKELMVVPGLPRFFRQGDDIVITTKISNLSSKDLNGTASLELLDALTNKPLQLPFGLRNNEASFSATKGQSTTASWKLHVPESRYEPVIVRISARAGDFTDGEENTLPVITNRMLVTETMPLWINGDGQKSFTMDKLLQSGSSNTLAQHRLTVEFTSNPAWYAVQALPYLMEYPYECAEQTFNRYYANALAAYVLQKAPKVKAVFDQWQNKDTAALLSNLEKNQELKTALLEETPWVMDAQNETEQKHRIALLFEANKLGREQAKTLNKLEDMLLPEGGFPWFKGMGPDRYITQYIATGISRLQHLGAGKQDKSLTELLAKIIPYLDRMMKADYDELLRLKVDKKLQHIGYTEVQYLYMRSFINTPVPAAYNDAYSYYRDQAMKYWSSFNPYMKGMIALALNRSGEKTVPATIIQSLKETAVRKEEMGMYWQQPAGYWWYEAPVESQSLLVECFGEVAKDTASVDALKLWLLKQKQTQNWPTTKATADACYALLLQGSQWLTNEPSVIIQLGGETIRSEQQQQQAGTGYFKTAYSREKIQPDMGKVSVTVSHNAHSTAWGAVYWQYFENMDKITGAASPLSVKKQLFIERNSSTGPVLEAITEANKLKTGDKVVVRIELSTDRDMEYIHLKDMRSACFEPVNVLSGYRWQGGLGYYESTKDISSSFFINYLPKGKYVFEYPVFVTAKGDFSNGITTVQCMYAPEFSSHSEGIKVHVE